MTEAISKHITLQKALANPTRQKIIELLRKGPRTTSEVCGEFDVSRFAVMKHLKVLEKAGVVTSHREGRKRWNVLRIVEPLNHNLWSLLRRRGLTSGANIGTRGPRTGLPSTELSFQVTLQAAPETVYAAWTQQIGAWWPVRANTASVLLETVPGGRFYEIDKQGNGGLFLGTILSIVHGKSIVLQGTLGVVDRWVMSLLELHFDAADAGHQTTLMRLFQRMVGEWDDDIVAGFNHVWESLLQDLLPAYLMQASVQE